MDRNGPGKLERRKTIGKYRVCARAQSLSHVLLFVTPWSYSAVHGILQARILEWISFLGAHSEESASRLSGEM